MMKRTSFFGLSSRRSHRSSQNLSTSASSTFAVEAETWITMVLNGLPWKQTDHSVVFEILNPSTVFQTLVFYEGTPFLQRDS